MSLVLSKAAIAVTVCSTFLSCRQANVESSPEGGPVDTSTTASITKGATGDESGPAPEAVVTSADGGAPIYFEGRFDTLTDPNMPTMGWSGSRVRVGFMGTKLTIRLRMSSVDSAQQQNTLSDTYLSVSVDESTSDTLQLRVGTNDYVLATGLADKQHEVVITKRTEGEFGSVAVGAVSTDGKLTFAEAPYARHIEIIGDSGATGWGAAGLLGDKNICASSSLAQDGTVAFPLVAGRILKAEVHNISYAGKGLVQNRDVANDPYKTLPRLWTRRLPQSPFPQNGGQDSGAWNPNQWIPDATVLVVSGNDFYANGGPDQTTFEQTVRDFISMLRRLFPKGHVYLMVSPMLHNVTYAGGGYSATARTNAMTWCREVIDSFHDAATHFLDIPEDNGSQGLSCDYHMTPPTHLSVGKKLASAIASDLGWVD